MAEVRTALEKRKADLLAATAAEVALIDQALGAAAPAKPAKPGKRTKAVRTPGIGEAVVQFVKLRPWSTIREIQPDANPSSVESTVRNLAAANKLNNDDGNPKKFAAPSTKPEAKSG